MKTISIIFWSVLAVIAVLGIGAYLWSMWILAESIGAFDSFK